MTRLYLDSSAIVKLVIDEIGSAELRDAIDGAALATSRIAVVEVGKVIARVDPGADPGPVLEALAFVELDEALAAKAAGTGRPSLRALDAIHVASAVLLAGDIDTFVTYDARQASAAREVGLTVVSPGSRSRRADAAPAVRDPPETALHRGIARTRHAWWPGDRVTG